MLLDITAILLHSRSDDKELLTERLQAGKEMCGNEIEAEKSCS